ncbi:hypothetical protein [Streptomyces achromogenes]|uniref:hypothetical protein n=1 Tax=Streptomyces achromogenes TaxID=67255 RepID=UPI0036C3E6C3
MIIEPEHTGPVPDFTIPLSAADAQALGDDVRPLVERFGAVLHGLAQLSVGEAGADGLEAAIGASTDLLARLEGIRNAAVRQHAAEGGSYGALAKAMDIQRATAQYRRDTLLKNDPSPMEQWAAGSN